MSERKVPPTPAEVAATEVALRTIRPLVAKFRLDVTERNRTVVEAVRAMARLQREVNTAVEQSTQIAVTVRLQQDRTNAALARFSRLVRESAASDDYLRAVEQVRAAAAVQGAAPDRATLQGIARLIATEELGSAGLAEADARYSADPEMRLAFDEGAQAVAGDLGVSRAEARLMLVVWVWFMVTAGLVGISVVPFLGAVPGALGIDAPTAAGAAGRGFDRFFPPEASYEDS